MSDDPNVDAAIERMQRKAAALAADQARLSSAMWGIYHAAGFKGLVAAVLNELQRIGGQLGQGSAG